MAIGDFVNKARGALRGNEDKAAAALGKVAGVVKGRTGPAQDRQVDGAVRKAQDFLEAEKLRGAGPGPAGGVPGAGDPGGGDTAPGQPGHGGTPRP